MGYFFGYLYLIGNCENRCEFSPQNKSLSNITSNNCYKHCKNSYYSVFDIIIPYAIYISFAAWIIVFAENILLSNTFILKKDLEKNQ